MKYKLLIAITLLLLLITTTPLAYANTISEPVVDSIVSAESVAFDDGSYAIIETIIETPMERASKKTATSTYTYYNSKKVKQWAFTLKGTFAYNGSNAKALSASKSRTLRNGWSCSSIKATTSGSAATGNASFKKSTVKKSCTIKLSCSPNGTIKVTKY